MTLLLTITALLFLSTLPAYNAYRVVCVYTNWAQYRPDGGKFLPEDVDAHLCTHIIYVYAKLKGNRLESVEWNDEDSRWSEGMYTRVNNLKQINPELKTLLGVGGWMMGSKAFSRLAAGRGSRRMFAQSTVKFLRDRGFDGLTIDWQHPTMRGGRARDKENFSLLLKELRSAFDEDGKSSGLPALLLTAGVSASKQVMERAYEIENITRYTDFLNVMAYDLHGSWENYTGHPSQLYARKDELGPSSEINVDTIMKMWIAKTGDRNKLNLGISTYGRTFTLKHLNHNGYQVPSKAPGIQGEFTQQPGMLAYYERCNQYFDASHVWDDASKASYWVQGDQWIAGEDVQSVKAKITWSKYYNIGGAMIWSMDTDDFGSSCGVNPFPISDVIKTEFEAKLSPRQIREIKEREEAAKALRATTILFDEATTTDSITSTEEVTTSTTTTTTVRPPARQALRRGPQRQNMRRKGAGQQAKQTNRRQSLAKQRENDRALLSNKVASTKQTPVETTRAEPTAELKIKQKVKPSQTAREIQSVPKSKQGTIQVKVNKQVGNTNNGQANKDTAAVKTAANVKSKSVGKATTTIAPKQKQSQKAKSVNGGKKKPQAKKNRRKRPKLTPRQREILRRRMARRKAMLAFQKKNKGKGGATQTRPKKGSR